MERDTLIALRELLTARKVLALAFAIDAGPEASLLPYALRKDFGALIVQASALARHSRALVAGAEVGVLIHGLDTPEADPLQIPRLSARAVVTALERDTPAFEEARATYIARFPGAEMTLSLADFGLYELVLGRGRFVEGFARAFNVGPDTFAELAAGPR
jgi:hypothetical protein